MSTVINSNLLTTESNLSASSKVSVFACAIPVFRAATKAAPIKTKFAERMFRALLRKLNAGLRDYQQLPMLHHAELARGLACRSLSRPPVNLWRLGSIDRRTGNTRQERYERSLSARSVAQDRRSFRRVFHRSDIREFHNRRGDRSCTRRDKFKQSFDLSVRSNA